jgi:hypothetical protein
MIWVHPLRQFSKWKICLWTQRRLLLLGEEWVIGAKVVCLDGLEEAAFLCYAHVESVCVVEVHGRFLSLKRLTVLELHMVLLNLFTAVANDLLLLHWGHLYFNKCLLYLELLCTHHQTTFGWLGETTSAYNRIAQMLQDVWIHKRLSPLYRWRFSLPSDNLWASYC